MLLIKGKEVVEDGGLQTFEGSCGSKCVPWPFSWKLYFKKKAGAVPEAAPRCFLLLFSLLVADIAAASADCVCAISL